MSQVPLAPPPPSQNAEQDRWLWLLWRRLTQSGQILWSSLDLTGSNLTDIQTRNHNDLQSLQGGTTSEYYHLTSAQNSEIGRSDNVTSVAVDTTLDDTYRTVRVTATVKIITLPAASTARIGKDWTVILDVVGYADIRRAGSDTIVLPEVATTVRLDNKGASVTFRCLSASSWGLA